MQEFSIAELRKICWSKGLIVTCQRTAWARSPIRSKERQGGVPVPARHRSRERYGEHQYQTEHQETLVSLRVEGTLRDRVAHDHMLV